MSGGSKIAGRLLPRNKRAIAAALRLLWRNLCKLETDVHAVEQASPDDPSTICSSNRAPERPAISRNGARRSLNCAAESRTSAGRTPARSRVPMGSPAPHALASASEARNAQQRRNVGGAVISARSLGCPPSLRARKLNVREIHLDVKSASDLNCESLKLSSPILGSGET
jgi:hypothetical protein